MDKNERWRRASYRYIHSQPAPSKDARRLNADAQIPKMLVPPKSGRMPRRRRPKTGPLSPKWKVSVSIAVARFGRVCLRSPCAVSTWTRAMHAASADAAPVLPSWSRATTERCMGGYEYQQTRPRSVACIIAGTWRIAASQAQAATLHVPAQAPITRLTLFIPHAQADCTLPQAVRYPPPFLLVPPPPAITTTGSRIFCLRQWGRTPIPNSPRPKPRAIFVLRARPLQPVAPCLSSFRSTRSLARTGTFAWANRLHWSPCPLSD